jgi:hypothetical protein
MLEEWASETIAERDLPDHPEGCHDLCGDHLCDQVGCVSYKRLTARTALRTTPSLPPRSGGLVDVDWLAQQIRAVDGNNSLGAGALAEALLPRIRSTLADPIPEAPADEEVEDKARALALLAREDERQTKLHDLLEIIREQIRVGVAPEHRPIGLMQNIQSAVYAMRGRTALMNDAAITSPLRRSTETDKPGVREAALKEAAKVADTFAANHAKSADQFGIDRNRELHNAAKGAAQGVAFAIRALSASHAPEEQVTDVEADRRERASKVKPDKHGHRTRFSDSSYFDEVCIMCGATDGFGDKRLDQPCPKPLPTTGGATK